MEKEKIVEIFAQIMHEDSKGIESFITQKTSDVVLEMIGNIETRQLSLVQLNQCLALQNIRTMSDGVFKYYWLDVNINHFYDIKASFNNIGLPSQNCKTIESVNALFVGFNRLFIDCLYLYGNISYGYKRICNLTYEELCDKYKHLCYDTVAIKDRGEPIAFNKIKPDNKYLVSETVCKNFGININEQSELEKILLQNYKEAVRRGIKHITAKMLLSRDFQPHVEQTSLTDIFYDDELNIELKSENDVKNFVSEIAKAYLETRKKALFNTDLYLSLANELDVYVATSMRNKKDFKSVDTFIDSVFKNKMIEDLGLRYFDPTMSAADGHENKGVIECLMVKAAKVLIYTAGEKDSYGKDAEAAMALSLGKPVIFYCKNNSFKEAFFRDVHPLSRLVNFETGVVGGAIVCTKVEEVVEILDRIFRNRMQYKLVQDDKKGHYCLKDIYTTSTIRVQTAYKLLESSFWNFYLNNRK